MEKLKKISLFILGFFNSIIAFSQIEFNESLLQKILTINLVKESLRKEGIIYSANNSIHYVDTTNKCILNCDSINNLRLIKMTNYFDSLLVKKIKIKKPKIGFYWKIVFLKKNIFYVSFHVISNKSDLDYYGFQGVLRQFVVLINNDKVDIISNSTVTLQ